MQIKTLKERAAGLVAASRFKEALAVYDELRDTEPNEGEWPRRAADCCLRLKDQDRRLRYSVCAARAYAESGHLLKAIAMYKVSLSINPRHAESRAQLARLHVHNPTLGEQGGAPDLRAGAAPNIDAVRAIRLARERREADSRVEANDGTLRVRARMAAAAAMRRVRARKHLEEQLHARSAVQDSPIAGRVKEKETPHKKEPAAQVNGAPETGAQVNPLRSAPLPPLELELTAKTPHPVILPGSFCEPPALADPNDLLQQELRQKDEDHNALRRTPLFEALDQDLLEYLVEIIQVVELDKGGTLFEEGDIADAMYVVVDGSVVARAHAPNHPPIDLAVLEEGEFFGEIGLLSDQPRQASVIAREQTRLLRFDRSTVGFMSDLRPEFLTILRQFLKERLVEGLMATSPLFLPFDAKEKRALAEQFEFLEIEPNSVLLDHGQPPVGMYVLLTGQALLAQAPGRPGALRRLSPGDIFGEQALLYNQSSQVQVRTISKCFALCLPSDAFAELIMAQPTVLEYLANLGADGSVAMAPDFLDHMSLF